MQSSVAAAYSTKSTGRAPQVQATRDSCRIRHRELVASVTGSAAFAVPTTLAIQPGVAATFPWLSTMAQGWEEYRFNKVCIEYLTRTGSTTPGSMMIVPDYDAADTAPLSEQIASSYEDTVEDAPWKDMACNLPSASMNGSFKRHFVRTGQLAANQDIKTYDSGQVFLCTIDGTAVNWGKVWIEYDVEFFIPALQPFGSAPYGGKATGVSGMTGANPFGTAPTLDADSRAITIDAASVLTFGALGDYLVTALYGGTTLSAPLLTIGSGVASIAAAGTLVDAGSTNVYAVYRLRVSNLSTATAAFTLTAASVTTANLFVASAPSGSLA